MRSPWVFIRESIGERTRRWARRRHGQDPPQLILASQRIYILPTPSGLVYAVLLATMLAGSMNYNNNLAFALTFLLAGIGIVAIYHTHRTLSGLRVQYLGAASPATTSCWTGKAVAKFPAACPRSTRASSAWHSPHANGDR